MAKHLVDIEEDALHAARASLHTSTIKDTVNQALRQAAQGRSAAVAKALDTLAGAELLDRSDAWG